MQTHCGAFGFAFTGIFASAMFATVLKFNWYAFIAFGAIAALFFLILWPLTYLGREACRKENRQYAWWILATCSGFAIVASSLLIWLSGGAASPFCAIYVMIHTLTLSSAKKRNAVMFLLVCFGTPLVLAFVAYLMEPLSPVPRAELKQFLDSPWYYLVIALGIVASIAVSSFSRYRVEREQTQTT